MIYYFEVFAYPEYVMQDDGKIIVLKFILKLCNIKSTALLFAVNSREFYSKLQTPNILILKNSLTINTSSDII